MAARTLCAEDVWPVVRKLPKTERMKLSDCLRQVDDDWSKNELSDLSDWVKMASPGDESLLDPRGGKPFSWKRSR